MYLINVVNHQIAKNSWEIERENQFFLDPSLPDLEQTNGTPSKANASVEESVRIVL